MSHSTRLALCDVRGPLDDLLKKLTSDEAEEWLVALKRMLRKENPWQETSTVNAPASKCLGEERKHAIPERRSPFDPREFFKTRTGLYVWDGFRDRILAATKEVQAVPAVEIKSFDLSKDANDAEIRGKLPQDHIFEDVSTFCALLAGMIEGQPNGKKGDLLANGYANIFYVCGESGAVFAVDVRWVSDYRKWRVGVSPLFDDRWGAGDRAFSRNC